MAPNTTVPADSMQTTQTAATKSVAVSPQTTLQTLRGFALGALAACGAVTFTNPWEVVKTRLQLQGELETKVMAKSPNHAPRPYPNAFVAFARIARTEGIHGIQRGLAPAYVYQILLNGTRLGLYDPLKNVLQRQFNAVATTIHTGEGVTTVPPVFAMVMSGAVSGVLGAFIASPLFLIKTRMQSYTPDHALAVGHQHNYVTRGTLYSIWSVYKNEGVRGLWRGADASMIRTGVGSAVQLSTYDMFKHVLIDSGLFASTAQDGAHTRMDLHFSASLMTSLCVCLAMNPFDVASTRMYNQHVSVDGKHGSLYRNGLDCIVKTVRAEGVGALYKGFFAHYLRIGPHTILTFVFLEQLRLAAKRFDAM